MRLRRTAPLLFVFSGKVHPPPCKVLEGPLEISNRPQGPWGGGVQMVHAVGWYKVTLVYGNKTRRYKV